MPNLVPKEEVLRFDITMNHVLGMAVLERFSHLKDVLGSR